MARPGVVVQSRADAPPRSASTDTSMAFLVGPTEKGLTANIKTVSSFGEYQTEFGIRTGFVEASDAAEAFFREGGAKLTVSRAVLGATLSTEEVPAGNVGEVMEWVGNDPRRARAALDAEQASDSPRAALIKQTEPLAAPEPDTSDDGHDVGGVEPLVVDATIAAGLARITKAWGPGQIFVAAPAALAEAVDTYTALLSHAAANNRIALLQAPANSTATALGTIADALRLDPNARYGALFAPAAIIPGLTAGTTRTVPASAVVAGVIARNDAGFTANEAAAGVNGESRFATDVSVSYTDAERTTLNTKGVDVVRLMYGGVRIYGYRTVADPANGWGLLSNARLNMAITAQAEVIGENYLFAQIDGRRVKIAQFGGDLTGMLVPYYEAGALFGASVDDAFYVDVGPAVNTMTTIAAGELHALLALRMSPFAEYVVIDIVKVATATPLSLAA